MKNFRAPFLLVPAAAVAGALALSAGLAVAAPGSSATDAALPKPVPAERYAALGSVSPFAPPSAAPVATPPPPPPPQPTWAEAWTLSSVAELGGGQYRLTLTKRKPGDNKTTDRIIVTTGQENPENIAIAGVQWSDKPEQTRITLNRGGVFAVFTFDPSALASTNAPAPSPLAGFAPGAGRPSGALGTPGVNMPQPSNRPGMQLPGGVNPPLPGAPQGFTPPPPPPPSAFVPPQPAELPQRGGTRNTPIPAAPPPQLAPNRVFQPPASGVPTIRELPGVSNADGDEEDP